MTNYEFYKEEILEIIASWFGVINGKPKSCAKIMDCTKCAFYPCTDNADDASEKALEWLKAEHKEPVKLSRFGCELLKKYKSLGFEWVARDENGEIVVYKEKPSKGTFQWMANWSSCVGIQPLLDEYSTVKWEDTEPTKIDGLLENCAIDEEKE